MTDVSPLSTIAEITASIRGLSNEGLPIGVQIIGRPFEDELVLAVAESVEQSRGPWQPPPLHNL